MLKILADRIRWQRLLWSCRLNPDKLTRPVEEPGPRDFIICGIPRSGTSLLVALLFHPPEVALSMEPWDGLRLPPADLFRSIRTEIDTTGKLSRGRLDVSALGRGEVAWHRDGASTYPVATEPGYALGVKWPGFWRYLDLLPTTKFLVCVRHPRDVVRSFQQTAGRLAQGLEYPVPFYEQMNRELSRSTADVRIRRAQLYEYIARRLLPHINRSQVRLIRYERWDSEPSAVLAEIGGFLNLDLAPDPQVPVRVSRPPDPESSESLALLRRYCPSAVELGYEL